MSVHVVFHLLQKYLRRFGPVHGYHMFPMERATNRRYPEFTVLESYRLFELTFFFSRYVRNYQMEYANILTSSTMMKTR